MPTLMIDDRKITVEPGTTVMQAADRLGIFIPRFCYHPGLSAVGSCRMCMVEVEKIPKLQTACTTPVVEGMVVHTYTEQVMDARRSVLEFLLINHPLDCPICDKAGECYLQDDYMEYARYTPRYKETRWKKRKVHILGPTIVMDEERCVLCSRCVRFLQEVTGKQRLGIFERGARSVLSTFPGQTLTDPYCGNIVDLCPVGALTDRTFRFQQRVWMLRRGESICPYCARGCNIAVDYNERSDVQINDRRVYRFRPRFNPKVNGHWICDRGRYAYRFIDDARRLREPMLREGKRLVPSGWERTLKRVARRIREVLDTFGPEGMGLILLPSVTIGTARRVRKLFVDDLGLTRIATGPSIDPEADEDSILLRRDRFPNRGGLVAAGFPDGDPGAVTEGVLRGWATGKIKLLYVIGDDLPRFFEETSSFSIPSAGGILILQRSMEGPEDDFARMLLPSAMTAETAGSFVNFEGEEQTFSAVLPPLEEALPDEEILGRLSLLLGLKGEEACRHENSVEEEQG
ncbi:MAG: 2Fe-2S iron-sulfur cluster binding domain-containing protein [Deltaproteobacteria bacterium]|nr:2Fe-2S iron-sulfur cluster binding domain-containing protein [Deltaproteobacteria bacterium]